MNQKQKPEWPVYFYAEESGMYGTRYNVSHPVGGAYGGTLKGLVWDVLTVSQIFRFMPKYANEVLNYEYNYNGPDRDRRIIPESNERVKYRKLSLEEELQLLEEIKTVQFQPVPAGF